MAAKNTSFVSQFGEHLFNPSDSTQLSPDNALNGKDYVMLYFSAHWCPPCRRFTPNLIELYKKLKSKHNMELIFCSLDKSEDEYKEYISNMPWLCMPFEAPESKALAKKYKASGIPHLVVVDESGKVITMDGTSEVNEDKDGDNFPWKPKSFSEIWPDEILSKKNQEGKNDMISSSEFKDKYLMLYFSASWCGPCQMFTPNLSKAYTKLKSLHDNVELVFVSSDRDEASFDNYHKKMNFPALPFSLREAESALSKAYEVSGIPTLVMLGPADQNGDRPLINGNVRGYIDSENYDEFPFPKKNYGDMSSAAEYLNDTKCLVILHENGDDEEQSNIQKVVKEIAAKFENNEEDDEDETLHFCWALSPGGIASQIRRLTNLPTADQSDDAAVILLNLSDNGGYYKSDVTDITVDNLMKFMGSPGDRLQLS